jgi:hypothetical protein
MEPTDPQPPNPADDALTLTEYFSIRSTRHSARIYNNLASDPVIGELSKRKKLNYRETLLIVSTVVASLDDEIRRLQEFEKRWEGFRSAMNAPLLAAPVKELKEGEAPPPPAEPNWFLRYLTLRNVLGVLVVVISLSAGFFAWLNKDYRSLLDGRDKRLSDAQQEITRISTEKNTTEGLLTQEKATSQRLNSERASFESRLTATEDANKKLANDFKELQDSKLKQLTADVKVTAEAQAKAVSLQRDLDAQIKKTDEATKSVEFWKGELEKERSKVVAKTTEANTKAEESRKISTQLEASTDAWNSLVDFLTNNTNRKELQLTRKDLSDHLKTLERYTGQIREMRLNIR